MVENNIIYVYELRRTREAALKLPLDTVRAKETAFVAVTTSGTAATTLYNVNSSQRVYVNQITATDKSGASRWFALSCYNLSGETRMTPPLARTASGQHITWIFDNRNDCLMSGAELVYSGQKIMVASGHAWDGDIGITFTLDPVIDE